MPSPRLVLIAVCVALLAACTIDPEPQQSGGFDSGGGFGGLKPDVAGLDTGKVDAGAGDATAAGDGTGASADVQGSADTGGTDAIADAGAADEDASDAAGEDAGEIGDTADSGSEDSQTSDDTGGTGDTGDTGAEDSTKAGCKAADPKSCDDGKPCTQDVCDEQFGTCSHFPQPAGTPCDGGFICTAATCQDLKGCVAAADKKSCDDGKPCTIDECIEGTGCTSKIGGSAPCDDGDPCTQYDKCEAGKCAGAASNCDDGWPCTKDSCDGANGCKHDVQLSGPCDDGNACTKTTECKNGDCKGADVPCDDGNSCTTDLCDPKKGCANNKLDSVPCEDGNACTQDTQCGAGACTGQQVMCDDGKSCTTDACDPKTGCSNKLKAKGAACVNAGTCDEKGLCSAMLNCGNGKLDKGEACDDGNKNPCDNCNNTCTGSGQGKQLVGSATVGIGGVYRTISEALAAVAQCGVSGPTTFLVLPGTHQQNGGLQFPNWSKVTDQTPITFKADPSGAVRLSGSTGTSSGSNNGVVKFAASAHDIVLDGFEIDGNDPANTVAGTYSGPVVFADGTPQKNITIRNLHIHDFGPARWTSYQYVGAIVAYNSSSSYELKNIRIEHNKIANIVPTKLYTYQGAMLFYRAKYDGLRIVGNEISGSTMQSGLNMYYVYGFKDLLIANNIVEVSTGYGIYWRYGSGITNDAYIAFNTFVMTGNASYIMYMYSAAGQGKLVLRNNILASLGTGKYTFYITNGPQLLNPGNNCILNLSASNGYNGNGDITVQNTSDMHFVSTSYPFNLRIKDTSACANKAALDIPGVSRDIDGDLRLVPTDIGADEAK